LVSRPFHRKSDFTQQGSYLRNKPICGLQDVITKLNQFSIMKNQGCSGVTVEQIRACQPTVGCITRVEFVSSEQTSRTNASLLSGGNTIQGYGKSTILGRSSYSKNKPGVSAFGPKHAEYARRIYQSKGAIPRFGQVLVPSLRSNYGPMQAYSERLQVRDRFAGERVFNIKNRLIYPEKTNGAVSVCVASEPHETVLRVANISPRPKKEFNKTKQLSLSQSRDFYESKDVSNAPLFKILCELSKM